MSIDSGGAIATIGFLDLLCIVFVVLKLIGIITWSWWLVLLPFYGPIVLSVFILTFMYFVVKLINKK